MPRPWPLPLLSAERRFGLNRIGLAAGLLAVMLAAGCRKEGPRTYRIPHASRASASPHGAPASPHGTQAPSAGLRWKVPAGWKEQAATSMRVASFMAGGSRGPVDVAVVMIPGPAGGLLANVNRWREQVGLPPLDDKGLADAAQSVPSPAGKVALFDLAAPAVGGQTARILAGVLSVGEATWFFKATGKASDAGAMKASFVAFLRSLERA